MDEIEQVKYLLRFLKTGTKILSARLMLMLALTLNFILFAWEMEEPNAWRFAGATTFAVLIFLPAVWLDVKAEKKE